MADETSKSSLPEELPRILPIRETYDGPLLPVSYTLKLDGAIFERKSKKGLGEVTGEKAGEVGRRLLTIHPSGGRLRISESGFILGFKEEKWIVIGAVTASEWFPVGQNS
jgi:hypothetical protein